MLLYEIFLSTKYDLESIILTNIPYGSACINTLSMQGGVSGRADSYLTYYYTQASTNSTHLKNDLMQIRHGAQWIGPLVFIYMAVQGLLYSYGINILLQSSQFTKVMSILASILSSHVGSALVLPDFRNLTSLTGDIRTW